ncbi:hypothetical protein KAR10_02950 [bacterium]|nr:hypothetical protein [bacterium]
MSKKGNSSKCKKIYSTGLSRACVMLAVFLAGILGVNHDVNAYQLSGENVSATLGKTTEITLPINAIPESGENIVALQFDLDYDKDRLVFDRVTAGEAAQQAGKEVAYNQVGSAANSLRVVVYGMNQNTIGQGTVANIIFKILPAVGRVELPIHGAIACNPEASQVEISSTSNGSVTIAAAAVASNLSGLKVFPNPYKPALGHSRIMFLNLPIESRIKIHKITGELIKEINEQNKGMAEWRGENDAGKDVASGVYLYSIITRAGEKAKGRIAVVR